MSFNIYSAFLANSGFDHEDQVSWRDLSFADCGRWRSLLYAAKKGYGDVVQQLLGWGADIEMRNYGWTLLFDAQNGCEAVVRKLLDHGAEIEAKATLAERH